MGSAADEPGVEWGHSDPRRSPHHGPEVITIVPPLAQPVGELGGWVGRGGGLKQARMTLGLTACTPVPPLICRPDLAGMHPMVRMRRVGLVGRHLLSHLDHLACSLTHHLRLGLHPSNHTSTTPSTRTPHGPHALPRTCTNPCSPVIAGTWLTPCSYLSPTRVCTHRGPCSQYRVPRKGPLCRRRRARRPSTFCAAACDPSQRSGRRSRSCSATPSWPMPAPEGWVGGGGSETTDCKHAAVRLGRELRPSLAAAARTLCYCSGDQAGGFGLVC